MNWLRSGRDPHLGQIENDFKDPEDGCWEKNNSEGSVRIRNSGVYWEFEVSVKYPSDRQFYLWHLVYSDRLFVLSNPTWRRAHVTVG